MCESCSLSVYPSKGRKWPQKAETRASDQASRPWLGAQSSEHDPSHPVTRPQNLGGGMPFDIFPQRHVCSSVCVGCEKLGVSDKQKPHNSIVLRVAFEFPMSIMYRVRAE